MEVEDPRPGYARRRSRLVFACSAAAAAVLLILNLGMGAVSISPGQVLGLLAERAGWDIGGGASAMQESVLWSIRVPRVLLAAAAGGGLAAAGAGLQAVFRTPLAESQLIGVSWGAAAGAAAAIAVGWDGISPLVPPLAGFAGGLAAALLAYRIARAGSRVDAATLLLAGAAVNAAGAAVIGILVNAVDSDRLGSLAFWSLGTLGAATWETAGVTLLLTLPGAAVLAGRAGEMDALLLGEEEAHHLGVDIRRVRLTALGAAALLTGAAVAAAGVIGFIGLLAPHAMRVALGPGNRKLIFASILAGAGLTLGFDLAARTAAAPTEIPLGVLTSLAGAPLFLWLLVRARRAQGGWG